MSLFANVLEVDLASQNSILNDYQALLSFDSITKYWLNLQNQCSRWFTNGEESFEQFWGVNVDLEVQDEVALRSRRLSRRRGKSKGLCFGELCPKQLIHSFPDRRLEGTISYYFESAENILEKCDRTLLEALQESNPKYFANLTEIEFSFAGETNYEDPVRCETEACQIQSDAMTKILSQFGTDFNIEFHECSWNYVNCDVETDIITSLSFFKNENISSTIPTDIALLNKLEWFDLPDNNLKGSIPVEVFNLTNLKGFTTPNNNLNGTIPAEIAALKNIVHLDLSVNELEGEIPTEVGLLENLEVLNLSENDLNGAVPTELALLPNLKVVNLQGNSKLSGSIAEELCEIVILGNTSVLCSTELPTLEFANAIQIDLGKQNGILNDYQTRLSFNSITKYWLNLQNDCSRWLPEGDESLEQFWGINVGLEEQESESGGMRRLSKRRRRGKSKGLCKGETCPKTAVFSYPDRRLEELGDKVEKCYTTLLDELQERNPKYFANLTEIEFSFTGETTYDDFVPCETEACQIQSDAMAKILNDFDTDFNPESNECSWNYVNCDVETDNITSLSFFKNEDISSTIPTDIALLNKLEWFDLPDNNLKGSIPVEVFNLTNLKGFTTPNNNLNGTIPAEIVALKNIVHLDLSGNELKGEIPTEVGLLQNLEFLDLSENDLSGEVPTELALLPNLKVVNLQGNSNLSGSVVKELCGIVSLDDIIACPTNIDKDFFMKYRNIIIIGAVIGIALICFFETFQYSLEKAQWKQKVRSSGSVSEWVVYYKQLMEPTQRKEMARKENFFNVPKEVWIDIS